MTSSKYDFGTNHGYTHQALVVSLKGVDKITQWSEDRPPDTPWNKFAYQYRLPENFNRMKARILHWR